MKPSLMAAALIAGGTFVTQAQAHGVAGAHMFVSTLIIDDPNVSDEASIPTFSYLPESVDSGPAPGRSTLNFEFDKRITENFGIGLNDGYQWLTQPGTKTANGWQNLIVTLKYKAYVSPEHEFMMSVGCSASSPAPVRMAQMVRYSATTIAARPRRWSISARG
jgi:hypothetical protein